MTFADQLAARRIPWVTEVDPPGYTDPSYIRDAAEDEQAIFDALVSSTIDSEQLLTLTADEIAEFFDDLEAWGSSPDAPSGESELVIFRSLDEGECVIFTGDPGELLSPHDIAAVLKTTPKAARRMIAEEDDAAGLIPGIRISERRMRVRRGDLDSWLGTRLTGRGKTATESKPSAEGARNDGPPPVRVYQRNPRPRR